MRVHLTQVTVIIGKDKREWLKVSGVLASGETVNGLLPKPDVVPDIHITPEDLANYPEGEVDFDQRGRIVEVR